MYICTYVYIYIYIHIDRHTASPARRLGLGSVGGLGPGPKYKVFMELATPDHRYKKCKL